MKAIVIGASLSGKTTIVKLIRKNFNLNICEIDEELTRVNGGVFPENTEKKHKILAPKIINQIMNLKNIIFFCNTNYLSDQEIIKAKKLDFKIIQLNITLNELRGRNTYRMDDEGYEDMSLWLEGMVEYQEGIFKKGFVDKRIDATQPTYKVVQDMFDYLSECST